MSVAQTKILFLNQMAGPLFRELTEDVAEACGESVLYTGHPHTKHRTATEILTTKAAPEYDRRSNLRRLMSWLNYFMRAFFVAAKEDRQALIFIVSNPPFLGLLGLSFKLFRKQKYAVLVYDVYPEILIALGALRRGLITRAWTFMNRFILERADLVVAISQDMVDLLEKNYDFSGTVAGQAVVIANWADVESIKPRDKNDNWFAKEHAQVDKITVLYSGNMGNTHDIESIVDVARRLRNESKIHFLFIGEGAKYPLIEKVIQEEGLVNVTLLPFQAEEVLPYSMTSGDIGIVAYVPGTEGCIVPSKTFYYMAAGLVPLIVCSQETDLSKMMVEHNCGIVATSGDVTGMSDAILRLIEDEDLLAEYKRSSRRAAEHYFSRKNTALYVQAIRNCLEESNDNVKAVS